MITFEAPSFDNSTSPLKKDFKSVLITTLNNIYLTEGYPV